VFSFLLFDFFKHHAHNNIIGNQLSFIHELFGFESKWSARAYLCTQHVTSGDMVEAKVFDEFFADSALTTTRRTHDERGEVSRELEVG